MVSSRLVLAVLLLVGSGAGLAGARERLRLTPSVDVSQGYDSNVFRRDSREQTDFVTQVRPEIELGRESDRGHLRLRTGLHARMFADFSDLNAVDSYVSWDVDRILSPRLRLTSVGRLAFYDDVDSIEGFGGGRYDLDRRNGQIGLRYALGPLSSVGAAIGLSNLDYSGVPFGRNKRSDLDAVWGSLSYQRLLGPRDGLSASLGYQNAEFSNTGSGEQEDLILSGTLGWSRSWTPLWKTEMTAGVRRLSSDLPNGTDRSLGFLGGATVVHELRHGRVRLGYERETRPASGLGASLDVDTLEARFDRRLSRRLRLTLRGAYRRYRSASDAILNTTSEGTQSIFFSPTTGSSFQVLTCVPGDINAGFGCFREVDNEVDSENLSALVRLSWRLREKMSTYISYRFRDQRSHGEISVGEYDVHRFTLGFRYAMPIDMM